ncbi:MAG: VanZ family protein [Alphaproteobacteria bacterium]|uniref:VanZ family protein n=1 Tax=Candidatus Nitrobium versatile TaxID=2884831 RepID=A0A953JA67_9BACT|nr:VanZ family protein [Candidatus Nitrobium versatile]
MFIERNQRAFKALFWIALTVISYLAFSPDSNPVSESLGDKISHVLAFTSLGFLIDGAYSGSFLKKGAVLLSYGFFIEIVQYFLPFREFSLFDIGADSVGIGIYFLVRRFMV